MTEDRFYVRLHYAARGWLEWSLGGCFSTPDADRAKALTSRELLDVIRFVHMRSALQEEVVEIALVTTKAPTGAALSATPAPPDARSLNERIADTRALFQSIQDRDYSLHGNASPREVELLTDEEIRVLTVWESDEEIPAFKAGWRARIDEGIFSRPTCPEGRAVHPTWSQNARVAWERGWEHADVVACFRTSPERLEDALKKA